MSGSESGDSPAALSSATLWQAINDRAERTPDAVMVGDEFERVLTNAEYRAAAEAVAAGLIEQGAEPGGCVSWQLPTGIEALVLTGALARLGVVQNPIIPSLRELEVGHIVDQCRPDLLIVPTVWRGFDFAAMAGRIAERHGCRLITCELGALSSGDLELPTGDPANLPPLAEVVPDAELPVRWIFYTSGTTDKPKGIKHTDRAILAAGVGLRLGIGLRASDIHPIAFPIAHIGGPALVAAHLAVGAKMVLLERFDPETSPEIMSRYGATILGAGQPFFAAYLDEQSRRGADPLFPALRLCASGGSPTPPEMHFQVKRELGGRGIATAYGLTEFPVATRIEDADGDDIMAYSVGRAGVDVEFRIVDPAGTPVPTGDEGEILVRGPQRMVGYVDPELDRLALDSDGFFRTGDLGAIDERGLIRITGRLKDIIIRNGENISAAEVEQMLLRHPAIADAAVVGVPDPRTGERLLAYVQPRDDRADELTVDSIVSLCRDEGLASYKIPELVEVIAMIPRNSLGKIQKTDLRERAASARAAAGIPQP